MKSKILLLTTMLASASFAFAQTTTAPKTVNYQGIKFELLEGKENVITPDGGEGQEFTETTEDVVTYSSNLLTVRSNKITTISNQRREINVKAVAITTSDIQPGQIVSWSENALVPAKQNIEDHKTTFKLFGVSATKNGGTYLIHTDPIEYPEYTRYANICQAAAERFNRENEEEGIAIVKGSEASAERDVKNVPIHPDLYYYQDFTWNDDEEDFILTYAPITSTQGAIYLETRKNNCYDTYKPTQISDDIAWDVETKDKVGVVSGVVNNERIIMAANGGARNFDFSNTLVLGKVELDIPANKLAYFPATRDEEGNNFIANGTNIVTGAKCKNYLIKDNNEEIYVSKPFTADQASYERKFNANSYGTIVLPFAASTVANDPFFEKLAQFTNYDPSTDVLTFTNTYERIEANRPYIFRLQNDVPEGINAINVDVAATPSKVASGTYKGATMYGTFQKLSYEAIQDKFGIASDGGVVKPKQDATLKPGRAYLDLPPFQKAKNFTIELVDEDGSYELIEVNSETTDIEGVISSAKVVSIQYIAIDGSVSTTPHKGMNIVKKTLEDGTIQTTKVAF